MHDIFDDGLSAEDLAIILGIAEEIAEEGRELLLSQEDDDSGESEDDDVSEWKEED
jgi:hypothetical protein